MKNDRTVMTLLGRTRLLIARRIPSVSRIGLAGLAVVCALVVPASAAQAFEAFPSAGSAVSTSQGSAMHLLPPDKAGNGMPEIVLVSPRSPIRISSPLDIELLFRAEPPAKIVPASLRVLYGFFGFDITDLLAKHAEFTEFGIRAKTADLPAGSHDITIEISDDRDRVTRKTFKIDVTSP